MKRRSLAAILVGALAIAAAIAWGVLAGEALLPSYLAAWLIWAGLPFGALTLLLILEIAGGSAALALVPALRVLAIGTPLASLLFIPVLIWLGTLYPWSVGAGGPGTRFGDAWLHQNFFIGRAIAYLLILSVLALLFASARPIGTRRIGALLGLFIVAIVGTLAATDWIMSLDPGLHSGEFGLLIISGQCAVAAPGAILLGWAGGLPALRQAVPLLPAVSAVWLYLHFMQFLVMWSGDLPHEAMWYAVRGADAGGTLVWLAFLGGGVLPIALLAAPWRLQARALPFVAAIVLLAHMAEALWFVTPAVRQHLAVRGPDALMLIGLGGIAIGLALLRPLRAAVAGPSVAQAEVA